MGLWQTPQGAEQRERAAIEAAAREVRDRIASACARAGRSPDAVALVAVSKTVPVARVRLALQAGLRDLGENHAAELARKAAVLGSRVGTERGGSGAPGATRAAGAVWHFIGRLQSGTVRHVADHADYVHSAEPGRAMEALARRREARGAYPLDVLIEVDFTGRRQGVAPDDLLAASDLVAVLPCVRLGGLMTMAPFDPDPEAARPCFARLRDLSDVLVRRHPGAQEISMGMSLDYEVAVEEGATMVRVGTALFGPRHAAG